MPPIDERDDLLNKQLSRRIKLTIADILITVFLISSSIGISIFLKEMIQKEVINAVTLHPNSEAFHNWHNPPVTSIADNYLFNITNPIDIVVHPNSATISLKESPAYSYNVNIDKLNVQWSNDSKELSYGIQRIFTRHPTRFHPSSVNDTGIFIDLVRALFRTQFQVKPTSVFFNLAGTHTFYHRNAVEQLEGFTSDLYNTIRGEMTGPNTNKSGFIYKLNGTRLYNVTIRVDQQKRGQITKFANEFLTFNITSPWQYKFPIYDAFTFPSMLFDKPPIHVFNSDFCSPVLLKFNRIVFMFGGMPLYEYKMKLVNFNNCTKSDDYDTCEEVDKLDISKCMSNTIPDNTMFLSKAHFYGSSSRTFENLNIHGFTPTSDKHESFIYFEPYSGAPLKAAYRIQINVEVMIDPMKTVKNGNELEPRMTRAHRRLIPAFWIDQQIQISEEVIHKIQIPILFLHYGQYFCIGLAILISISLIILLECISKRFTIDQ